MNNHDFQSISDILDQSSAMKRIRERSRFGTFQDLWKKTAGEKIARLTRATRYKDGKLSVEVFSPPLFLELSSFKKPELLKKLRSEEVFKGIVDIVFRAGSG